MWRAKEHKPLAPSRSGANSGTGEEFDGDGNTESRTSSRASSRLSFDSRGNLGVSTDALTSLPLELQEEWQRMLEQNRRLRTVVAETAFELKQAQTDLQIAQRVRFVCSYFPVHDPCVFVIVLTHVLH
jgi:hypothetical protein